MKIEENSHYFQATENIKKTAFSDMNEDCVFLILEQLDCGDLLSVAQIDENFSTLAADVFLREYSHLRLRTTDNFPLPNGWTNFTGMTIDTDTFNRINDGLSQFHNKVPSVRVIDTNIDFHDYGTILSAFKHFGHAIKKFKCTSYSWAPALQAQLIGYLISEHSSESLDDIEFALNVEKLLKHITKPLINVKEVTFRNIDSKLKMQNFNPNEMFPALRRLYMNSYSDYDLAYFNYHIPNLEHVTMHGTMLNDNCSCVDFIMKNPQIRSIELYSPDFDFIRHVSDSLPRLETFTIQSFSPSMGSIRFETVTTLIIEKKYGFNTLPSNFDFPRLHTFNTDFKSANFIAWYTFLNRHNHLKHLYIHTYEMDDIQFQKLTANLTDLEKLSLEHHSYGREPRSLSFNIIAEFLESHDKMKQLNVINFPKHFEDELQERLKHGWNVKIIVAGKKRNVHVERV